MEASANDDVLLGRLVRALGGVPGIRAIVLGGSRARGEATAQSDYDIGLYYEADNPIDIGRLAKAAMLLPGAASSSVTAIGEWGPWINGGAWLTVGGQRVDLLYRELGKVRGVIEACCAGTDRAGLPARPSACLRLGDLYGRGGAGQVLWDPENVLASLQRRCTPYPPALGEALIRSFLWEAKFSLENAAAWPRQGRPGLCRGLRLPRRRLPLPEPVRAERRLSPERERARRRRRKN